MIPDLKKDLLSAVILAFILSFIGVILLSYIPLYGEDIGLSVAMIGYVVAVYQLAQLIGRIPMGALFDILGYGRVIVFGGIFLFLAMVFYLISPYFWPVLFLAQILIGLAVCIEWVVLPSFVTEIGGNKISFFTFFTGLACTLSISLGGILKDLLGMQLLFFLGLVLSLPVLLIAFSIKKNESPPKECSLAISRSITSIYENAFETLKSSQVLRGSLYSFLMFMGTNLALSLYPLYLSGIGISATIIGTIQCTRIGPESIIRIFSEKIEKRLKRKTIIAFTTIFYGLALLLVSQIESLVLLIIISILWGISGGLYAPVVYKMIANGTEIENRGKGMGIRGTMGTFGSFTGIIIFSNLAEIFTIRTAISLAGILMVIGVIVIEIYMRFRRPQYHNLGKDC